MPTDVAHQPGPVRSAHRSGAPFLLVDALATAAESTDFVGALRVSASVADEARASSDPVRMAAALGSLAQQDAFAAMLAIESLGNLRGDAADELLIDHLWHPVSAVRRHASWRLANRQPSARALGRLFDQLVLGGVDTLHAHRTLRQWALTDESAVVVGALSRLSTADDARAGARLVDLLGAIPHAPLHQILIECACDPDESLAVRLAAIGALGERTGERPGAALERLARLDGDIGAHAAVALHDLGTSAGSVGHEPTGRASGGLRVAQLVLAGSLDGQLSLGGRGDTGGVASLLVSLGEALAQREEIDHVLTIGRGTVTDALTGPVSSSDASLTYGTVVLDDPTRPATTADDTWERLPSIERSLRRILRRAGRLDVLHLRMADAGALAGDAVARQLGVPTCFSVAPDPHNVVHSLQSRGELDRASFVELDHGTHVWFRARLVERLTCDSSRLALFPRSRPRRLLRDLGVNDRDDDRRVAVVPEGIDVDLIRRVEAEHEIAIGSGRRVDVAAEVAGRIPEERRALPLLLSVGRLHPVKGMERIVDAWAADPDLRRTCNLVIVGGDLHDPSPAERAVIAAIDRAIPPRDERRAGLVLLGGRPHADIARLLVVTAKGMAGCCAPGGVYVDGALKEEFGLAVIEALAAGLSVVAPATGGPPTYVSHGDTGILVEPSDGLVDAIHEAFRLVELPGRSARARSLVEERYSIETMATTLTELYRSEPVLL